MFKVYHLKEKTANCVGAGPHDQLNLLRKTDRNSKIESDRYKERESKRGGRRGLGGTGLA